MSNGADYQISATPAIYESETLRLQFLIRNMLANVRTSLPVEVVSCTNSGGVSAIGYVDIRPLVGQVDGEGNIIQPAIIYNVPYIRAQGGSNAVIIDPVAGDIGVAAFADRDISSVKASHTVSGPGSKRRNDLADAIYLGTVIGGAPTQYVQFNASGITIKSPVAVAIDAPSATVTSQTATITATASAAITSPTTTVTGNLTVTGLITGGGGLSISGGSGAAITGSMTVTGDVTASGTSLHTHTHGGVTTGAGSTGVPN